MWFDWVQLRRRPTESLPTVTVGQRGQIRMLTGDSSTIPDTLHFGRDDGTGTMEWFELTDQGGVGGASTQTPGCTWGDGINTDSITVGTVGYVRVPYAGTISEWCVVANASCTCTIDVWRTSAALPVNGDSIAGTGKPALTAAVTAEGDVSLWSSATVTADDVFGFELESLTGTPSAITVTLKVG